MNGSLCELCLPPTLRIAAGLLLAVLLRVVGYQVVRRLNSHGPEALLKRADGFVAARSRRSDQALLSINRTKSQSPFPGTACNGGPGALNLCDPKPRRRHKT